MQTLTFYVTAGSTLGTVRDYANAQNAAAPTLTRGVSACLKMRLCHHHELHGHMKARILFGFLGTQ